MLKNKDPLQILADLERLDQQEYNIHQPPTLAEKVLKDKRRKLTETWNRVIALYRKEDTDRFLELKRLERDYEAKRDEMAKLYHAVKSAEKVVLDEIPLPVEPDEPMESVSIEPGTFGNRVKEIGRKPPGCPPGIPPKISDLQNELADLLLSNVNDNDDLSQFLKEIDQVKQLENKKKENDSQTITTTTAPLNISLPTLPIVNPTPSTIHAPVVPHLPYNAPVRPNTFSSLNVPSMPSMSTDVNLPNTNVSYANHRPSPYSSMPPPKMLSKQSIKLPESKVESKATIEAKPLLRNLSADATRFLPVSLRVKRTENNKSKSFTKTEGKSIWFSKSFLTFNLITFFCFRSGFDCKKFTFRRKADHGKSKR